MPTAPISIFTPTPPGGPPTAPRAVFAPAPAGKQSLVISGVTTAGINGAVIYAGLQAEKAAWSTDGTLIPGSANTIVEHTGGAWKVSRGSSFSATKTSSAATPEGLTAWTVGTGTGSPVIAAGSVGAPPAVFGI